MAHLDILREWYRRVWIEGDLAAIDELFADSAGAEGIMADGQASAEDFRAFVPAILAHVREPSFEIVRSIETGDWVWAQLVVRSLTAQGLDPVTVTGQVACRIAGGRIAEAYNAFDFLPFFEQAGLLPQNAFLLLLSGERLVPG
jgi:hypothetical protein